MIETWPAVPWTKPENLTYDPDGPLPELRGLWDDFIRLRMADVAGRRLQLPVREASWRAAITRNGGDRPGSDWGKRLSSWWNV